MLSIGVGMNESQKNESRLMDKLINVIREETDTSNITTIEIVGCLEVIKQLILEHSKKGF